MLSLHQPLPRQRLVQVGRPGESSTPTAELPGLADVVKQEGQKPGISSNAPNCYTNGDLGIEGSLAPPEVEARRRPLLLRASVHL